MRFRLAPNLSTLHALERPKRPSFRNRSLARSYGAHQKNLNEDRHKLSAGKCRTMILVSRNVRYIRDIRERSLGRGVKRLWVVEEPPIYLRPCIVESVFSLSLLVT